MVRSPQRRLWSPLGAAVLILLAGSAIGRAVHNHVRVLPLRQQLYQGIQFSNDGRPLEAEREWLEILRRDREYAPAWKLLAGLYTSTGRWSEAREALARLTVLTPQETHVLCQLATAEWVLSDEKQSFLHAEQELRRAPECVEALGIAAQLAEMGGDQKKAVAYLRRAATVRPEDPALLFRLAMSLLAASRQQEARRLAERIVKLTPDSPDAHGLLGVCLLDEPAAPRHLQRAAEHLQRALELEPNHPEALLAQGRLSLQLSQPGYGVEHLERAAALSPTRQRVFFELARAYEANGQPDRATRARKRFLELKHIDLKEERLAKLCALAPDDFSSHLALARMKLTRGDLRRAEHYLLRALELKPDEEAARRLQETLAAAAAAPGAAPLAR